MEYCLSLSDVYHSVQSLAPILASTPHLRQLAVHGGLMKKIVHGEAPDIYLPSLEILVLDCVRYDEVDILSSIQMPKLNTLVSNNSELTPKLASHISRLILRETNASLKLFGHFSFPKLSEVDIIYGNSVWCLPSLDCASPPNEKLEECVRDLIEMCSRSSSHPDFDNSCPGVQKVTLMPCSEKMREWLGVRVKEMSPTPYGVQVGYGYPDLPLLSPTSEP